MSSSSWSESEDEESYATSKDIGNIALSMRRFKKDLKRKGYKFLRTRYTKNKRGHATIVEAPSTLLRIIILRRKRIKTRTIDKKSFKQVDKKFFKQDDKPQHKKKKYGGQTHVSQEWDSNEGTSSDEKEKVVTVAINKTSSSPRLFNNLTE